MLRRVLVAALLGWVVLTAWTFFVNGIMGFRSSIDMKQIPNERQVYETLKTNVVDPGRYICNPEPDSSGFPANQPVFSIQYSGFGHESAGKESTVHPLSGLLAVLIATWMLSVTSGWVRARYFGRVLFFAAVGLLVAAYSVMTRFGIGGYSMNDTLLLSGHDVITWTLVGSVVAWRMTPEPSR
jgi:hypothetical protein